ncbi:hypothetical protein TanjilG_19431 [Lupinus angustifolius]|uniref:Origin recognition complex subunit 2 n=1 Tax=Lupinus angustifolius TaxID=3871 RepID=A0A4P1R4I5_LUPAN|nr:hypothetical protein TanjilG_19431 [Lupinus angustifolius]
MDMEDDLEEVEFEFSRNYFLAKESGSGSSRKKSTHKLTDIDLVDEQKLREAACQIEPKHQNEIVTLIDSYKRLYPEWLLALRCGFGLLMYGFGSKKAMIEDFASTALTEYSVLVINGYLHTINLKQVLIAIAEILLDQVKTRRKVSSRDLPKSQQPLNSQSIEDLLTFLDEVETEDNCFVCVIIHNIDGPGLRDSETQNYLARLAACTHICVVASVDHVNAPLFWDKHNVHTQFKWCWYHVPTFAPYKVEGTFYPPILAHGMETNDLYSVCREHFLVSSQVTLNSHLTEFKDHELVKIKRHSDGQDCLYIPLAADALRKVLSEIS